MAKVDVNGRKFNRKEFEAGSILGASSEKFSRYRGVSTSNFKAKPRLRLTWPDKVCLDYHSNEGFFQTLNLISDWRLFDLMSGSMYKMVQGFAALWQVVAKRVQFEDT